MNFDQLKKDFAEGTIVCRKTIKELIAAHDATLVKAARWDFIAAASDNQDGPEAALMNEMDDCPPDDDVKLSDHAAKAIDAAIAKLAAGDLQ